MTLHICRDFLAKNNTTLSPSITSYTAYISACFISGVLRFTQIGHTNFDVEGSTFTKGSGINNANLNLGGALSRAVQLPVSYVVSSSDLDRIIALKSNVNGKYNSGLYRISAFDTATNSVILNARSWPILPTPETNLSWKIFEKEESISFSAGLNTQPVGSYRGWGNATTSRVILQSPHASGWQVRICRENGTDAQSGGQALNAAGVTMSPGFGGDSFGDFALAGKHLHTPLFYNSSPVNQSSRISGRTPGPAPNASATTQPARYYFWGDDETGACFILTRQHSTTVAESQSICCFGIPTDEEFYPNQEDIHRLFAIGNVKNSLTSNENYSLSYSLRDIGNVFIGGSAFGLGMQPITCCPSSWCFLNASTQAADITYLSTASPDSFTNRTELSKWDLIAGTYTYGDGFSQPNLIDLEPRRIGTLPFARKGRTNTNTWSTATDESKSWLHVELGLYLPWEGPVVP
jgi:hypothetical protein